MTCALLSAYDGGCDGGGSGECVSGVAWPHALNSTVAEEEEEEEDEDEDEEEETARRETAEEEEEEEAEEARNRLSSGSEARAGTRECG